MKISNLGVASSSLPPQPQVEETAPAGSEAAPRGVAAGDKVYSPSPEFVQLIHMLRQHPEVREDRVSAASQRLGQGDYHTQTTAKDTAAAILNALD